MRIVIPKVWAEVRRPGALGQSPLLFLAGPIRGAGAWQERMIPLIAEHRALREATVACPCRWDTNHQLAGNFAAGRETMFTDQLSWERYYLEEASDHRGPGCIVFWLAAESHDHPHPGPEPYAMDTRGELGEWRWRIRTERARVVIGAEEGFFGLSQIRRNFNAAAGYDFPIYSTMEETIQAAAELALRP